MRLEPRCFLFVASLCSSPSTVSVQLSVTQGISDMRRFSRAGGFAHRKCLKLTLETPFHGAVGRSRSSAYRGGHLGPPRYPSLCRRHRWRGRKSSRDLASAFACGCPGGTDVSPRPWITGPACVHTPPTLEGRAAADPHCACRAVHLQSAPSAHPTMARPKERREVDTQARGGSVTGANCRSPRLLALHGEARPEAPP